VNGETILSARIRVIRGFHSRKFVVVLLWLRLCRDQLSAACRFWNTDERVWPQLSNRVAGGRNHKLRNLNREQSRRCLRAEPQPLTVEVGQVYKG